MKKLDNFSNCLEVLKGADYVAAENDEIYRMGVIGQFHLTFELAWKALQAVLREHGANGAQTGSPRDILQIGYKFGFLDDEAVWMLMLKKRNNSIHIYNEEEADEMMLLVRDSFTPAFERLVKTLTERLDGIETEE
ncbi:MAG: HI0074 family nucleotidyltransferase substrate-binding subunit [Clostridiales bacterium]|nr:HI0074 family nucleotidyltransferase substrate-binding subunit [Clostridiales bacterium]